MAEDSNKRPADPEEDAKEVVLKPGHYPIDRMTIEEYAAFLKQVLKRVFTQAK